MIQPWTRGLISLARLGRSALLRRLRCQSLICLPCAFFALPLMAGEKPVKSPSAALGQAAPEGVAEEIEAGVPGVPPAVRASLQYTDLRLHGVRLESPQRPEPIGDRGPQHPGLVPAVAVSNDVIRVALKRAARNPRSIHISNA